MNRKKHNSGFRKGFRIYMTILTILCVAALAALWVILARFQSGEDAKLAAEAEKEAQAAYELDVKRAPQRAFEDFLANMTAEYWTEQWFEANADSFDDEEKVTELMGQLFFDESFAYWKAEEYTDEAPAYILKNGEQELAVLTFSGSELDWAVSEVEMRLTGKEEASLEVPENCTVYCNGKALEERFAAESVSHFADEGMEEIEELLSDPTLWSTYTVSGQLFAPVLTPEAPADRTLVTDEDGFSYYVLSAQEAQTYQDQAEAFAAQVLHFYMMGASNPYGNAYNVKAMAIQNSQVWKLMDSAAEGVSWNTPYPNYTHTVEAGNAIRWAENCLSVDVKYHAEGTAEGYTNTEDGTYRVYFLDNGNGFGIYGLAYK